MPWAFGYLSQSRTKNENILVLGFTHLRHILIIRVIPMFKNFALATGTSSLRQETFRQAKSCALAMELGNQTAWRREGES